MINARYSLQVEKCLGKINSERKLKISTRQDWMLILGRIVRPYQWYLCRKTRAWYPILHCTSPFHCFSALMFTDSAYFPLIFRWFNARVRNSWRHHWHISFAHEENLFHVSASSGNHFARKSISLSTGKRFRRNDCIFPSISSTRSSSSWHSARQVSFWDADFFLAAVSAFRGNDKFSQTIRAKTLSSGSCIDEVLHWKSICWT